jgi:predicted DNA-binding transcriptional regulator AlpA
MEANTKQAKEKVVAAIEKVVQAAKELSQAELEYLGAESRSNTVKLICGVASNDIEPLLLSAEEAARLCGVGRSLWYSMSSAGQVPLPVRLSNRVLWSRKTLESWIAKGCPSRAQMEVSNGC